MESPEDVGQVPYWVAYVDSRRDKHALLWAETDAGYLGALMTLKQIWQQGLTLPGVEPHRLQLVKHAAAANQGFILRTDFWTLTVKEKPTGGSKSPLPTLPPLPLQLKDGFQVTRLTEDDAPEVFKYMAYYNETMDLMKVLIRCKKTLAVRSPRDAFGKSELAAFVVERAHGEGGLLYTKTEFRGRGFSKLLHVMLTVDIEADGVTGCFAEVSPQNRAMRLQQIALGSKAAGFSCWVYVGKPLTFPQSML